MGQEASHGDIAVPPFDSRMGLLPMHGMIVQSAGTDGKERPMQQQLSVITLGIAPRAFEAVLCEGFGWKPAFRTRNCVSYQMNGFVLGTWLGRSWRRIGPDGTPRPGPSRWPQRTSAEECTVIDRLAQFGGRILRPADAPIARRHARIIAVSGDHTWRLRNRPGRSVRKATSGSCPREVMPASCGEDRGDRRRWAGPR